MAWCTEQCAEAYRRRQDGLMREFPEVSGHRWLALPAMCWVGHEMSLPVAGFSPVSILAPVMCFVRAMGASAGSIGSHAFHRDLAVAGSHSSITLGSPRMDRGNGTACGALAEANGWVASSHALIAVAQALPALL
jgi:hypothetical protein